MVPYSLYMGYLYVCLQKSEWLASAAASLSACGLGSLVKSAILRPSLEVSDARQFLIVGTMSSGTTQVAHDLASHLKLEIGHDNSETKWSFVRDGTISWFHGIRFLERPGIDNTSATVDLELTLPPSMTEVEGATQIVTLEGEQLFGYLVNVMCQELHPNMGFHPFMFRDSQCSMRQSWDSCWRQECRNLLNQEWGCALREADADDADDACTTPYRKILHQFRNPLKTVESLVTKFCIGGVDGELQPAFEVFAKSLFAQYDFSKLSCVEASGYYVYEYNQAILSAKEEGLIDASFKVEGATPCEVAKLAGFLEISGVGYQQRIRDHLMNFCGWEAPADNEANQPMVSTKNKYNQGQLSLEWDDLLGGKHGSKKNEGDPDLQQKLKQMARDLGY
jgi:hypothetical protein